MQNGASELGSTGYQSVPSGCQPVGTGSALENTFSAEALLPPLNSAGLVAQRHGQVARATIPVSGGAPSPTGRLRFLLKLNLPPTTKRFINCNQRRGRAGITLRQLVLRLIKNTLGVQHG